MKSNQFQGNLKIISVLLCLFCLYNSAIAQKWEILNTQLKAERKTESLVISFLDDEESLEVKADTAYLDNEGEYLLIQKGSLVGIVDPWDLHLLSKPVFRSVKSVLGYFQVEDNEGYYFVNKEEPGIPVSETFADIQCVVPEGIELSSGTPILVMKNGKYGIFKAWDMSYPAVEIEYDEIVFNGFENDEYYFLLRKGNKWGAGGCEGLEVEPRYDKLDFLSGVCTSHLFIAWRGDKCGIVQSSVKKPLLELEYTEIKVLKEANETSWYFLFKENELVSFINTELSDSYVIINDIKHIIHVKEIRKTYLVYMTNGEEWKLVLPESFYKILTRSGYMNNLINLDI